MIQEGQGVSEPLGNTPSHLQVVLFGYDKDGRRDEDKDRYGVIRFPESFEAAITSIERTLGEYLPGGKADLVNIFCQMPNYKDNWVWVQADCADWDVVREQLLLRGRALGIRQRIDAQHNAAMKPLFIKGPITLVYGDRQNGNSQWIPVAPDVKRQIDRPESYQEARKLIIAAVTSLYGFCPAAYRILERLPLSHLDFKFYYFVSDQSKGPNTELWTGLPTSAYEDDEVWRAVVPGPYQMLGYTLERR